MNNYEESLEKLKQYMKIKNIIPSEKEWNRYAKTEKCLSSKSIEYGYGFRFNKMCRKLIKEIRKKKNNLD